MMRGMLVAIRNAFITGLFVILPLGVTIFIINFLLGKVGSPASQLFFWFLDDRLRDNAIVSVILQIVSTLVVFCMITALGFCSRFVIARFFLTRFERLLDRVPIINTVYRTVKQIVDTFSEQKKAVFQEVVLLEYPRKDSYALGFLTSRARGEIQAKTGVEVINVFVPTTPNPTSGFLLMLPKDEITSMDMTVAEGMKLIISGGAVVPPWSEGEVVEINNPASAEETALRKKIQSEASTEDTALRNKAERE